MAKKLLVMCASRGRPTQLNRMVESVFKTSTDADVAVYLDFGQESMYLDIDPRVHVARGPQVRQCASLNTLCKGYPGYLAYGAATDDCEFLTPGWDQWALKSRGSFPGHVGAIAPKCDMDQRMDFPWFTDAWIMASGLFCPLGTVHMFWDVALEIVAEHVAIAYANDDEFKIAHHAESPADLTYSTDPQTAYADWNSITVNDGRYSIAWLGKNRRELIAKLREAARG